MRLRTLATAALVLAGLAVGQTGELKAQGNATQLIGSARTAMGALEFGAAVSMLRLALDSSAGASRAERVRALVLLCAAELNNSRPDSARTAAQAALALEPQERVDSLDAFGADLVRLFRELRPPMPASLEFRGLPPGAQLLVDGVAWAERKRDVPPGMHRIEASGRGYVTVVDSVTVDPSLPTIRTIVLAPAEQGRLSVSSVPWGLVYLDSDLVGETPVFDRALPSGRYALSVRTPAGAVVQQQQIQLQPGRATNLGTIGRAANAMPVAPVFARSDSLFNRLEFDSALALYRALVRDTVGLPSADLRAHAANMIGVVYYAMASGRQIDAYLDSARAAFEQAFRLAPTVVLEPSETGEELRAFADSARANVLTLVVTAPPDTVVPQQGGRVTFAFTTSRSARLVAALERQEAGLPPIFSRVIGTVQNAASVDWDLRMANGQQVPSGSYRLRVTASDASGRSAQPETRLVDVEWERPDTAAVPGPLDPSAFAAESQRIEKGPTSALLLGALIGGATAALPSVLANSEVNSGLSADPGAYIAAGASVFAGIMAYVKGHRDLPLPSNIEANRRLRAEHDAQRTAIIQSNARARDNVRARIRVEAAQ